MQIALLAVLSLLGAANALPAAPGWQIAQRADGVQVMHLGNEIRELRANTPAKRDASKPNKCRPKHKGSKGDSNPSVAPVPPSAAPSDSAPATTSPVADAAPTVAPAPSAAPEAPSASPSASPSAEASAAAPSAAPSEAPAPSPAAPSPAAETPDTAANQVAPGSPDPAAEPAPSSASAAPSADAAAGGAAAAPASSSSADAPAAPSPAPAQPTPAPALNANPPALGADGFVHTTYTDKAPGDAASGLTGNLQADMTKLHNDFRSHFGAAPLTWDDTLAAYAANNANACVFQHTDGGNGKYGENIVMGGGQGFDTTRLFNLWTSEEASYDYNNPGYSPATGHFTQIVWKGSSKLGCASAQCSGQTYIVCEYDPRGNMMGSFPENVARRQS